MRGFLAVGLALGLGLACQSSAPGVQGSGVAAGEDRTVEAFTRVELLGSANLELEVGPAQRVRVEADDNIVPLLETTVSEGALRIASRKGYSTKTQPLVRAAAPVVTGVALQGAGDVTARGIAGESFVATIKGAGNMNLAGTVGELELRISGAGDVDASGLTAARVVVHISGSGDVKVSASERVEAHISGSGDVKYAGGAKDVVRDVSGSGSVEPM
ncbi:MAG: DUF2807 domain-containing protein [Myxococcales bacterium]|nr:DUF2807 domain-containing protein [Myxococcales bacterium]